MFTGHRTDLTVLRSHTFIASMRSFLLTSLASLSAVAVYGHPTHNSRGLSRRAVDLDLFRVKVATSYKNATAVIADPTIPTLERRATAEDVAFELVQKVAPDATFRLLDDHYVGSNGIAHFYYTQTVNGLDVDTANFNVNVRKSLLKLDNATRFRCCPCSMLASLLTTTRLDETAMSSLSETPSTRARFLLRRP